MPFPVDAAALTGSGLFNDVGVDVRVLPAFGVGTAGAGAGCAVKLAQVIAGVLELEAVPFVVLDSTRESAGKVAVTACNGPFGKVCEGQSFVVRNTLSNFTVLN